MKKLSQEELKKVEGGANMNCENPRVGTHYENIWWKAPAKTSTKKVAKTSTKRSTKVQPKKSSKKKK